MSAGRDRTGQVTVIAVGNRFRRDDGVGPAVLDLLGHHGTVPLHLVEADAEPTRLVELWAGLRDVVVVDAVLADDSHHPGEVLVLDTPARIEQWHTGVSSHSGGLADAVRLGRALDRLPDRLVVVGVVVADLADGEGLTAEVAGAVVTAADAVLVAAGEGHDVPR